MKQYTVIKTHKGRVSEKTGTIEELNKYFRYTLECGNSWNKKINRNPKTGKGLIVALTASVQETQGGCYDQDSYDLKDA